MKTQSTSTKQHALTTFGLFGLFMIFSIVFNPVYAQRTERAVSGVVSSTDGPLLGAAIVLKGTATGVISNDKGEFTFPQELKENDVLLVSYLGYETAEIIIASDTTIVNPYLQDIPIVIVAALRTKDAPTSFAKQMN